MIEVKREAKPGQGGIIMHGVTISELIKKMKLKNTTPEIDTDKIVLTHPDVNRPALQLTGFFDHFDRERVQIIGYVEQAYINTMDQWKGDAGISSLSSYGPEPVDAYRNLLMLPSIVLSGSFRQSFFNT